MKIRKIEARLQAQEHLMLQNNKLKVACYVRVSTTKDEQKNSFAAQIDFYTKKIKMTPEWEFAGAYYDNGISGTSKENRKGFNKLIEDALTGKIDLILTKSISRFARNTVDNIQTIRKLQEMDVVVYFEKEDIWTNDKKGEFLLTLMASFAQEESRSIAENTAWGHRRRFENGKYSVNFTHFLGYKRGKNGEFVVDVKQAKIVRELYLLFLQGFSVSQICKLMEEKGIPSPGGKMRWHWGTVNSILSNEKYKGDALSQKYYTPDFLTHKQAKNNGELEKFYVSGGHEAIIPPDIFDYVQGRIQRRKEIGIPGGQLFAGKILCGQCGSYYCSRYWHSTTYNDLVWQCNKQLKGICNSKRIYDISIQMFLDELFPKMCGRNIVNKVNDALGLDERTRVNLGQRIRRIMKSGVIFSDMLEWAFVIEHILVFGSELEICFIDGCAYMIPFPQGTPRNGKCLQWSGKTIKKRKYLSEERKEKILYMHTAGFDYRKIAEEMAMSVNTVRAFCRKNGLKNNSIDVPAEKCWMCGNLVKQKFGRKVKKFCSDKCRNMWWNANLDKVNRKTFYEFECKHCKKIFSAYGNSKRQYCSYDCYIQERYYTGE